eukprot:scaffold114755_cov14-Prasinocladus_malaysianus.AAC.1
MAGTSDGVQLRWFEKCLNAGSFRGMMVKKWGRNDASELSGCHLRTCESSHRMAWQAVELAAAPGNVVLFKAYRTTGSLGIEIIQFGQ